MPFRALLRTAAVLALLLGPLSASAHVLAPSFAQTLELGPHRAVVELIPFPLHGRGNVSVKAVVLSPSLEVEGNATLEVTLEGGTPGATVALAPQPSGAHTGLVPVPGPGAYRLLVRLGAWDGIFHASTPLRVYPDLPLRIEAVDAAKDFMAQRPERLAFRVVHPVSRLPAPLDDLAVRLEDLDGGAVEDGKATREGDAWVLVHAFPREGLYRVRFASVSGNFSHDDVPPLEIDVRTDPTATRGVPGWTTAAAVGALLAAARGTPGAGTEAPRKR